MGAPKPRRELKSTLTRLVTLLRLVDDINATTAANHLVVTMTLHERFE